MCLDHHNEYDSITSQTKNLQPNEAKAYRGELYETYANWESFGSVNQLFKFLAATTTHNDIVAGAVKVASNYRISPESLVEEVLTTPVIESIDADRWVPHLALLEDFQSWGFLTFEFKELSPGEVRITVEHAPICEDLAAIVKGSTT